LIGAELQRRSGLPWVADFRDPMAQDGYPADPKTWAAYKDIESRAMQQAAQCIFTTPGAARLYRESYPDAVDRIAVIENGYDEESFAAAASKAAAGPLTAGALTLLHSGIVYPSERDPTQLFIAMARLLQHGLLSPGRFKLRFRAPVHDDLLGGLAREHGVERFVEILPPVGYQDALQEMLRADALLVMQASNCNEQIPAKIYEYLRAGRPLLCLTDPAGDTAALLRNADVTAIARLDSADEIATLLERLLAGRLAHQLPRGAAVTAASRIGRTGELARRLEMLDTCRGPGPRKGQAIRVSVGEQQRRT
jgi:glycosyltransferase involved in cell wall biosynthesis